MECPKCQFDNREEVKFCEECGAKFEIECSACTANIPFGRKYCGNCGQEMAKPSVTANKVSAFEGERKRVTILFSDVSGYTAMAEKLDPEEVKDIMSQIFGEIAQVVAKYEGFIERFIGDAVMALFGIPRVHEDDAVRAIRTAREIHSLVEAASPRLEKKVGHRLSMHSGINTGLVVTGEVNLEKGTHGITGDAINLASRLADLAGADEILVGYETYRQAEGYFIFEAIEPLSVKGKEKPVIAYRMIAPSTRRTRFEVSAQKGLTPLIGREHELEQLLNCFDRARKGRGQAVSMISHAGVGKSRLLYEFRKAVAKEDVTFLEGRCLSYGKGVAYHPVIDILKSNFDVMESDGDQQITDKISGSLKTLDVDLASTLPYLLELLSVKHSSIKNIPMTPEAKKNRILESIKSITLKGAEIRPLILAIEDLHWLDKSSEDVIKELLDCISEAKVLLLFTFRPEFIPHWALKPYHTQLNLNRLSERQTFAMISHLLGSENIDIELENLLIEKTGGIPLFLEEFIRSFIDLKFIEKRDKYYLAKNLKNVNIPSTIQDVIIARVDSLSEGAKEVVQNGSVIGREFSFELINKVTGFSETSLLTHLNALRESELVYERGIFPRSTNIFKHALTRDVVYNSLLNRRKKELHQHIGLVIEESHQDDLEEVCEALAEHFEKCEDFERAVEYFKLAGAKATNSGAIIESVEYARRTVNCLERLPKSEEVLTKIVDIRTILGIRLMDLNYFHQSKEMVSSITETATDMGRTRRIAQINTILGSYYFCVKEDFSQAFDHHNRSLNIARDLDDTNLLGMAHYWLGWPLAFNCEFESALDHFLQSLDIHVQAKNPIWVPIISALTGHIAYYYWGQQDLAYEYSNKAVELADESGDVYSRLLSYSCHGVSCLGKGDIDCALRYLSDGLAVAVQVDQFYWVPGNNQFLGDTYHELGEFQKAIDHYQNAIRNLGRSGNLPSWKNLIELALIRTRLAASEQPDFNPEFLAEYLNTNELRVYDGLIRRHIGEIMMYMGKMEEAEYWFEEAAQTHQKNEMNFHLACDYVVRGIAGKRVGKSIAALQHLTRAIDIFKECGADGWVEKYEKELIDSS